MGNSSEPIHPVPYTNEDGTIQHDVYFGLTKREHFSLQILSGLCVQAIPGSHNSCENQIAELVPHAIKLADALLKELDKK